MESKTSSDWLSKILQQMASVRVAVCGDFCVDCYWLIEDDETELSIETGLPVRRIREQRYGLGGAGNVVANLAALGVKQLKAVGFLGNDLFGAELVRQLQAVGASTDHLIELKEGWQTPAYIKPCIGARELNRLDVGAFNRAAGKYTDVICGEIERAAEASDVVIFNQQLPATFYSEDLIGKINAIIESHPKITFVVDSRQWAGSFKGAILKVNAHEAARLLGKEHALNERISRKAALDLAENLTRQTGRPVFLTRGDRGMLVAHGTDVIEEPGIQLLGKTDPVGAGDTVVAVIAAALASGNDLQAAVRLANLAASITVRKLMTTGTVTPAELLELDGAPDYIYQPELAEDPRAARFAPESEIEIIHERPRRHAVKHAIFDHDGTISVLRQGWEKIMEPMMLKAILGPALATVSREIHQKVAEDVRVFIDRTTGIQTLAQMKGLIGLVREYGFVPRDQILDEHGYKAVYNRSLLEMVQGRVRKIERGELSAYDYEIKGARNFLKALHAAGVKLYLASGTDEADVKAEAGVMGYADYFTGGIHGAVGDLKVEAKRVVLERIIKEGHLSGDDLVVVGDGPVEMREGRKRDAFCLGIASNELVRYGLDLSKRSRLIRAGADIIVPDFSQLGKILPFLGLTAATNI